MSFRLAAYLLIFFFFLEALCGKNRAFPGGSVVKKPPAIAGDVGSIPRSEDPLEKEMATHSSILAREILWIETPAGCSPWGCKRVGHDLATKQQQ